MKDFVQHWKFTITYCLIASATLFFVISGNH